MPPKRKGSSSTAYNKQDDVSSEEEYKAPKKKAKAAAKKKGKGPAKKKLELFVNAPLDIITEILSYLDTPTVLAISRTCAALRNLTHGTQSKAIWRAAADNYALLPAPTAQDLHEWELASLVTDRTCHVCHKGKAITVDYVLRARGCASCMRANSRQESKISQRFHRKTFDAVPVSDWNSYSFYWIPDLRRVHLKLTALEQAATSALAKAPEGTEASTIEEVKQYNKYLKERKAVARASKVDGRSLQLWEARYKAQKANEESVAKERREKGLRAKFAELGYTEQELNSYEFSSHALVNQPRDLTERIWNSARGPLTEVLDRARQKIAAQALEGRRRDRRTALRPFYDQLLATLEVDDEQQQAFEVFLPFAQWVSLSSVEVLWSPDEPTITKEEATPGILAEALQVGLKLKETMFASLAAAYAETAAADSPALATDPGVVRGILPSLLSRPTSSIGCPNYCAHSNTFPAIFAHARSEHAYNSRHGAFNEEQFTTSAARLRAIRLVMAAANLEESEATIQQLEDVGKKFSCGVCADLPKSPFASFAPSAMAWSDMILHVLARHPGVAPRVVLDNHSVPPGATGETSTTSTLGTVVASDSTVQGSTTGSTAATAATAATAGPSDLA